MHVATYQRHARHRRQRHLCVGRGALLVFHTWKTKNVSLPLHALFSRIINPTLSVVSAAKMGSRPWGTLPWSRLMFNSHAIMTCGRASTFEIFLPLFCGLPHCADYWRVIANGWWIFHYLHRWHGHQAEQTEVHACPVVYRGQTDAESGVCISEWTHFMISCFPRIPDHLFYPNDVISLFMIRHLGSHGMG